MKFTLDWMQEFVDLPTNDPEQLTEALESLGHEVEGWEQIGNRIIVNIITGLIDTSLKMHNVIS